MAISVLTEWAFDPGNAPDDATSLWQRLACGGQAGLRRVFLDRARQHAVALHAAPDVEQVSGALQAHALHPALAYPVHPVVDRPPPHKPGYSVIVAQRDLPGMSLAQVEHAVSDPLGCNDRNRLTHFGAYFSQRGIQMCCMYVGPDVESVRIANRTAGTPWRMLWPADVCEAPSQGDAG